jgi:hypothetical protein
VFPRGVRRDQANGAADQANRNAASFFYNHSNIRPFETRISHKRNFLSNFASQGTKSQAFWG